MALKVCDVKKNNAFEMEKSCELHLITFVLFLVPYS